MGLSLGVPILAIAYVFGNTTHKLSRFHAAYSMKKIMGVIILVMSFAMLFNLHHSIEAVLVNMVPDWWIEIISF